MRYALPPIVLISSLFVAFAVSDSFGPGAGLFVTFGGILLFLLLLRRSMNPHPSARQADRMCRGCGRMLVREANFCPVCGQRTDAL